jgi:hypothetical protein
MSELQEGPSASVEALKIAQQLREYHHHALWEEEKHFTWIHSIIVAAQAAILTKNSSEFHARGHVVITLAAIGIVLVVVALRVLRREGAFFVDAQKRFVEFFNDAFPQKMLPIPSAKPNRSILAIPFLLLSRNLAVRDAFQLVLIVFGTVYVVLIISILRGAV